MDTFIILTKVYACGHETFVPVPKDKLDPSSEESVHFSCKCDNCNFPQLLQRFRRFNNPSNKFILSTVTLLAYDMFDSRQCLSVENMDSLMRHWMRGIQCQICGESKHKALFDGLAQSVAEQDGPLAGKEMRALLESGYIRFVKKGRGYSRPVSRMRSCIRTPRIAALLRPGSTSSLGEPLSPIVVSSSYQPRGPHISSQLASGPIEPGELDIRLIDDDEPTGLDTEAEDEGACRLRLSLERLHGTMKEMGLTDLWGNHDAEAELIHDFCDDLQKEAQIPTQISIGKQPQASKGKPI
ncbi:hypothetical protein HD806DRAFT_549905 [Xylariaceae sp. AK1471]|nr:hypothetical protein HD806DRAFT_549905 [Xylariaceae sp. AK1471]